MVNTDIDVGALLAEAEASAKKDISGKQQDTDHTDVVAEEPKTEEATDKDESEGDADAVAEPELSPEERNKKLSKALERDKRKRAKLVAQVQQGNERASKLEQAIAELTKRFEPPAKPAVDENDPKFTNYGDYLTEKAVTEALDRFRQESAKTQQAQFEAVAQERWVNDQRASITSRVEALEKSDAPDYAAVTAPYQEALLALPDPVKLALLGTPGAELAVYQMALDDEIEDLAFMSFEEVKAAIATYAQRAQATIKARKTSRTPAPLTSVKGTGRTSKSLGDMSSEEILKWAGIR